MLRTDISKSRPFASLSPNSQRLFVMMIPHLNSHGKMEGQIEFIKGRCVPLLKDMTLEVIENCLLEITNKTSIKWFEHDDLSYIHCVNWDDHQEFRNDRRGTDILPNYSRSSHKPLQEHSTSSPDIKEKIKEKIKNKVLKPKNPAPEGYNEIVAHVMETYRLRTGNKYPFRAIDGQVIKRLLGLYGIYQIMAMWDLFLEQSWDFTTRDGIMVKIAHDLQQFQAKVTIILENPAWKTRAEKYEGQTNQNLAKLTEQIGRKIK